MRQEPPARAPEIRNDTETKTEAFHAQTFHAQTFPHIDAVYSDAFWLTGNPEDAADLVVETYARAFRRYNGFRRRRVSKSRQASVTLAWLYWNMHAAFCDRILAQERIPGDRGDRP